MMLRTRKQAALAERMATTWVALVRVSSDGNVGAVKRGFMKARQQLAGRFGAG